MKDRTLNLQIFRIAMVIGILFYHQGKSLCGAGSDICSFFFVLSGFLYKGRSDIWTYINRKVSYLYPRYWTGLVLSVIVLLIEGAPIHSDSIWSHILMIQSWIPCSNWDFFLFTGTGWFLSSLLFCYVLSPRIFSSVEKQSKITSSICLTIVYMLLCIVIWVDWGEFDYWASYVNPVFRCGEYIMGMLLRHLIKDVEQKRINLLIILFAFLFYWLLLFFRVFGEYSSALHACMIAFVFCFHHEYIDRIFRWKLILSLAPLMFWVFLLHQSVAFHLFHGWH